MGEGKGGEKGDQSNCLGKTRCLVKFESRNVRFPKQNIKTISVTTK